MTKRSITATAPNGEQVSMNVGPKRVVGAIRVMDCAPGREVPAGERYIVTVHRTLPNAITGPNQTPVWNKFPRWAIAIDDQDQPTGTWLPASK